jgi:hypothetical protein
MEGNGNILHGTLPAHLPETAMRRGLLLAQLIAKLRVLVARIKRDK